MTKLVKPIVSGNEQESQFTRSIPVLIIISWIAYTVVIFIGIFTSDNKMAAIAFAGAILQTLPYFLLRKNRVISAG